MTQEEFTYMANGMRAKAVSVAEQFGYSQDDAEDIAQDVMLRLWSLHEQLRDAAHLKASTAIYRDARNLNRLTSKIIVRVAGCQSHQDRSCEKQSHYLFHILTTF